MRNDLRIHVRHSNLIEGVDDSREDNRSVKAWKWLASLPYIDTNIIKELHHDIMRGQLHPKHLGEFRKVDVTVGGRMTAGSTFVPYLMANFCYDLTNNYRDIDPQDMHVRFEKIHPFIDGNGRTGRMLMWWHEAKLGRKPTLIRSEPEYRQQYYDWFQ